MNFINFVSTALFKENPLVIALQGPTFTGCADFADYIENIMKRKNINTLKINVESYYKTFKNDPELIKNYDIHNPAAIDWDLMRKTFDDLATKNENVQMCRFNWSDYTSNPYFERNSFPDVIIVDGPFALNLFNDKVFNVSEYDCMKSSSQRIDVPYVVNPNNFSRTLNVKKGLFYITKEEAFSLKVGIDHDLHNSANKETRINFKETFDQKIWASIDRWIYTLNDIDFFINGNNRISRIRPILIDKIIAWVDLLNIGSQDVVIN